LSIVLLDFYSIFKNGFAKLLKIPIFAISLFQFSKMMTASNQFEI